MGRQAPRTAGLAFGPGDRRDPTATRAPPLAQRNGEGCARHDIASAQPLGRRRRRRQHRPPEPHTRLRPRPQRQHPAGALPTPPQPPLPAHHGAGQGRQRRFRPGHRRCTTHRWDQRQRNHHTQATRRAQKRSPKPHLTLTFHRGCRSRRTTGWSSPPMLTPQRRFSSTRSVRRRVCQHAGLNIGRRRINALRSVCLRRRWVEAGESKPKASRAYPLARQQPATRRYIFGAAASCRCASNPGTSVGAESVISARNGRYKRSPSF